LEANTLTRLSLKMRGWKKLSHCKDARDVEQRKALQKELKDYQKRMADIITTETRVCSRNGFLIHLSLRAEKVGINARAKRIRMN